MNLDEVGSTIVILWIAWTVFVIAFMIAVWGHVAALRKRYAPQTEDILWESTGRQYAVGVSLAQPAYAVWQRESRRPVAIFPFSSDGRVAAVSRQQELEAAATPGGSPPAPV